MKHFNAGARPSTQGPASYFTGQVRIDPVIEAEAPARVRAAHVTFEPGARTAWHTHPLGQTLVILSGKGLVQSEGQPVRSVMPGDVIWFEPGEKHWHGATPASTMTHLAIHEALDGKTADWLELVSDQEYGAL